MILKELCVFFWKFTTYIYIHYPHSRRYVSLIVKEWVGVCILDPPKNLLVTLHAKFMRNYFDLWGQNWWWDSLFPGFTSSKIILNPSHPHEPIYVNMSCFYCNPLLLPFFLNRLLLVCWSLVGQKVQSIWNHKIATSKAGWIQEGEKKGPLNLVTNESFSSPHHCSHPSSPFEVSARITNWAIKEPSCFPSILVVQYVYVLIMVYEIIPT